MKLTEKIKIDIVKSMKSKDKDRTLFLKTIKSEFDYTGEGKDIDDVVAIKCLKKLLKSATEMNNDFEIEILNEYLPKTARKEDVEKEIESLIKENNFSSMKDMGTIMGYLKSKFGESLDGKVASSLVKNKLT
jgi:uncharacterized protein YqeY